VGLDLSVEPIRGWAETTTPTQLGFNKRNENMNNFIFRIFLIISVIISITSCAVTKDSIKNWVVAEVNEEPITIEYLQESFEGSHQGHSSLLAGEKEVGKFLNKVIEKKLLIEEARKINFVEDPDVRDYVEKYRLNLAKSELYKNKIEDKSKPSKKEILAAYDKLGQRFKVNYILTYTKEEAEKALERIKGGEEFGLVASQVSKSPSAKRGGDLGFVVWGQLPQALEEKIFLMKIGEVSNVFETEDGYHILNLVSVEPNEKQEFKKEKERIAAILSMRKRKSIEDKFYSFLRKRWNYKVFDEFLNEDNFLKGPYEEKNDEDKVVLAKVENDEIILSKFRSEINLSSLSDLPKTWALKEVRRLLDEEINNILLGKEAYRLGFQKKESVIRKVDSFEEKVIFNKILKDVVLKDIAVTDEEALKYYNEHPEEFIDPEKVYLSFIKVASEDEAKSLKERILKGENFAKLAKDNSLDKSTASLGGDFGWILKGSINPEIEKNIFGLSHGEIGIVKIEKDFYVIKVGKREPESRLSFSESKEKAKGKIFEDKKKQQIEKWVSRLKADPETSIKIYDDTLKKAIKVLEKDVEVKAKG